MSYKLIVLSTLFFQISCITKLPLPQSMNFFPVTYEKVNQINGWSCGYNVLHNATVLEKRFGINQPNESLSKFFSVCLPYLKSCNKRPYEASSNKMLDDLSKLLKLSPFSYLHITKSGQVEYVFPHSISYSYSSRADSYAKEKAKQSVMDNYMAKKNAELKKYLADNRNRNALLHFGCHVISGGVNHAILITLVQDSRGKKHFYINDNMNSPIYENSEAKKCVAFLYKYFA